jgi:hypothetical protein
VCDAGLVEGWDRRQPGPDHRDVLGAASRAANLAAAGRGSGAPRGLARKRERSNARCRVEAQHAFAPKSLTQTLSRSST